jgi:hypothetical protein
VNYNPSRKQLTPIAKQVRLWAEELIKRYGRDTGWWTEDMCGLCGIASAELWSRLKEVGIGADLCVWIGVVGGHVFVETGDYVLDVTATQFGSSNPKVVIYRKRLARAHPYWNAVRRFYSVQQLHAWQKREKWPIEQQVIAFTTLLTKVDKKRAR